MNRTVINSPPPRIELDTFKVRRKFIQYVLSDFRYVFKISKEFS